jgi:phage terminase small subunit
MPKRATDPATEYRHREFAKQFAVDFNGGAAVERTSGYTATGHSAIVAAGRLLKEPDVQQYIREELESRNKRIEIDQDSALRAQEQLAFWDARDYVKLDGERLVAKKLEDLTPDQSGAICKIKIIQQDVIARGAMPGVKAEIVQLMRIEYELDNKHGAIQSLFRHLGLYEKDNQQVAEIGRGLSSLLSYTRNGINGPDEGEC